MLPQPLEISSKLCLLLDDAPVVHPMKVALLAELVPGALGLLRDDAHLVQLLLEGDDALVQVLVPDIDVGNGIRVDFGQLPLLL